MRFQPLEVRDLLAIEPLGAEFGVNPLTLGNQGWISTSAGSLSRTIAMAPNGDYVVAWSDDPDNQQISARQFNAQGVAQGSQFTVSSSSNFLQANPSVAMDGAGNFVVAWDRDSQSGAGVLVQQFDASGTRRGIEIPVTSIAGAPDGHNAVAMDLDGDFVVVWERLNTDGNGIGVYGQRFNASGIKQGGEFLANTFTTGNQSVPQVAIDAMGNFVVVWVSNGQDGSEKGIYGQRFAADGSRIGGEFRVNSETGYVKDHPSVAMNLTGAFVVSWDGNEDGILLRQFDSAGVALGSDMEVSDSSTQSDRFPSVAIDGDGNSVVTWQAFNINSTQDTEIYARPIDRYGQRLGQSFRVNSYTSKDQNYPAVAADLSGHFTVVWSSLGQGRSSWSVRAQQYQEIDSGPLGFSIDNIDTNEISTGTNEAVFTVTLHPAATKSSTVTFRTLDYSTQSSADYVPTSGTLTFNPGDTTRKITVAIVGDNVVEPSEFFRVSLNNPVNASINRSAGLAMIVDDDEYPVISINDAPSIVEGHSGTTSAVFTVTLSRAAAQPVSVSYTTWEYLGKTTTDFPQQTGAITFAPGETSRSISISVVGDTRFEPDDWFWVGLFGEENAAISRNAGLGVITNDDPIPSVGIADVSVVEGVSGTNNAVANVTLSSTSSELVIVAYSTGDGSAYAVEGDYIAKSGVLTFAPGETSRSITFVVRGDTSSEENEFFIVRLATPTNTILGNDAARITILSDDVALPPDDPRLASVSIDDVSLIEGNSGRTNAVFTVTLSATYVQDVTVNFVTDNLSAYVYHDYIGAVGTVTFAPGTTTQTITIAILGEVLPENDESFAVRLSSPVNAKLGNNIGYATILNDDLGWHNYSTPTDVNRDGAISAIDLLHVADALNTYASTDGYIFLLDPLPIWQIDVDDDLVISAIDLVLIVDALNKADSHKLIQFAPLAATVEPSATADDSIAFGVSLLRASDSHAVMQLPKAVEFVVTQSDDLGPAQFEIFPQSIAAPSTRSNSPVAKSASSVAIKRQEPAGLPAPDWSDAPECRTDRRDFT